MKKQTKRTVNAAIGVRKEIAQKFSAFCTSRGLVISYAAEQALAAWMRETARQDAGGRK